MRQTTLSIAAALLITPALSAAADPAPPAAEAPAAAALPATASSTPPATTPPEYTSYVALKGGWFGSEGDFEGDSFSGAGTWEIAYGAGKIIGVEFSAGSMVTKAAGVEVSTVPLLFSLRLQLPIAIVYPFAEVGGGLYVSRMRTQGSTFDDTALGLHGGLGCDVHLGRVLVGIQGRYMGITQYFETVEAVTLDRYEVMLRAGYLF